MVSHMPIPENLDEVTPQWLTQALVAGGLLPQGQQVATVQMTAHTDLYWIEARLDLTYTPSSAFADHTPPPCIWLKLAKEQMTNRDMLIGRAEIQHFRTANPRMLAEMADPPVLRHYGAAYDEQTHRFYVLLEDPTTTHRPHRGPLPISMQQYRQALNAMARCHAFWWENPEMDMLHGIQQPERMETYAAEVRKILPHFVSALGDHLSGQRRDTHWRCVDSLHLFQARYETRRNLTLVHGDLTSHKVLYPSVGASRGAILLDWTYWRVGIAAHDQGYLLALNQPPARRRRTESYLLRYYHKVLCAQGVTGFTWRDCWRDYRLVMIDLLFLPMWQWHYGFPPAVWWPALSSVLESYEDLNSQELLSRRSS